MPNVLINEIEYCNMMGSISKYILRKVISDYNRINEKVNLQEKFYLSINVSLKEIEDDEIVNYFTETIKLSNLNRNSICIEITENICGQDINKINENINLLKEAGFMIAIDDFGVDYSNLYMLDKIQYDIIKLDKFFISDAKEGDFNTFIIEVSDYLSIAKNKVVIVEGVETKEQRDFIKKMKSDKFYIQGYYYSKPVEI